MMKYPEVPERKHDTDVLVSRESDVKAPMETVFEVIEDLKLFVELEENVQEVTITSDIKCGEGLTSHWVLEDPGSGEKWEVDEKIIHYDKPRQISYVGFAPDGKDYAGTHNLRENPDGTTHHVFHEMFYFDADPGALGEVVGGMVENVKKESERRAAQ